MTFRPASSGWLTSQSFSRGDRVAVLAANSIELLLVTVGCLRAGIVPVPISPLLTQTERSVSMVEDSGARLLFTDQEDGSGSVGAGRPDGRD